MTGSWLPRTAADWLRPRDASGRFAKAPSLRERLATADHRLGEPGPPLWEATLRSVDG